MSAVYLTLLLLASLSALASGTAAVLALRTVRRQAAALQAAGTPAVALPAARTPESAPGAEDQSALAAPAPAPAEADAALRRRAEIREAVAAAVTDALAEQRERELGEARAFWAAQEAHGAADAAPLDAAADERAAGPGEPARYADGAAYDESGAHALSAEAGGPVDQRFTDALREAIEELVNEAATDERSAPGPGPAAGTSRPTTAGSAADGTAEGDGDAGDPTEQRGPEATRPAIPDMRRHPSHPDFRPSSSVTDQTRTTERLTALASSRTPLTGVRHGPLGSLDVYVFGDGTTLCVTPGDRTASERLAEAVGSGEAALLMGGSGIGGAYALTFSVGQETVYVLADRVVASV